jgi:hypothetical protein
MKISNDHAGFENSFTLFRARRRGLRGRHAPRVGTRMAGLMELSMMLVVTILVARWVSLHLAVPSQPYVRLEIGGVALGLVLLAEFGFTRATRSDNTVF